MARLTRNFALLLGSLLILRAAHLSAQPNSAAIAAFNKYAALVESRLARQHSSPTHFVLLPDDPAVLRRLRSGEFLIEKIPTRPAPDALLHDWSVTAFVPNSTVADFEHLLQNFSAYPNIFAPAIVSSTVLSQTPTDTLLRLRTREHHVITVVLDTTVDVTFASPDPAHGYSISRSTRVDEITPPGDTCFLYRLNTYWSYEQRDGGLYLQLESVSLTRDIPRGLAWIVNPYLDSIPRDSLILTLNSARNALRKPLATNH